MKKNTGIPRAAVAGLALCAVLLTGCTKSPSGTETTPTASSSTSQSDGNLSFVAADKSNWDKEVAIGDSDCQRTPAFSARKLGFCCNLDGNEQISVRKWSHPNSIGPAFSDSWQQI